MEPTDALDEHLTFHRRSQPVWATPYHETVTDLRKTLMGSAQAWDRLHKPYWDQVSASMDGRHKGEDVEPLPEAVAHAQAGLMMASSYAYTLAAVLGHAEKTFGPKVARALAWHADMILTNGDGDDCNADVAGPDEPDPAWPDTNEPQQALD